MAAGDVQITRGIVTRDDLLNTNNWVLDASLTLTTDGDIGSFGTITTTNGATWSGLSFSSTAYSQLAVRAAITSGSGNLQLKVTFSDATTQALSYTLTSNLVFQTPQTLTSGKTVNSIKVLSSSGTSAYNIDFIYFFKEQLTLPAVSEPLQFPLSRYVVELAVPSREGGILQDLGSSSPQLELAGRLITTSSPNNYTGDQWWDVLAGMWLEANWQWLSSDRVAYKYQIVELTPVQNPGQVGYYGFKMRLRKIDILSATAQTFGSNTGTGAIQ